MKNDKGKSQSVKIKKLIDEFNSLEKDLKIYKKSIQKIKDTPDDKNATVVSPQQKEIVEELENIAKKLEALPKKWKKETE